MPRFPADNPQRQVGPVDDLSKAKISELVPKGAIPYSKRPGFEEGLGPTQLICACA